MRCGSSPLTRGKLLLDEIGRSRERLIPAHAGKTRFRASRLPCPPAHPRSRGENASAGIRQPARPGSSPLTRGKRREALPQRLDDGLIPAHAGKTGRTTSRRLSTAAHPRSRGENNQEYFTACSGFGSSPLTRGKPGAYSGDRPAVRLIPAHAGKTTSRSPCTWSCRAHPRSRGENADRRAWAFLIVGSSPLTRGKPHRTTE